MVETYVEAFLLARQAEGVTPKTLEWHGGALRLFLAWLREHDAPEDPERWDAALFRRYVVHLQQRPTMRGGRRGQTLRPATVTNYVQSLLAFTKWLAAEEYTTRDVAAKVRKPRSPQLVQQPVPPEDVARLVQAARADKRNGVRDLAMLYLLLDSGLRANELCGLTADDVLWSQNLVKVHGKGQKQRVVPFGPTTAAAMRKYALKGRVAAGAAEFFQTEEGRALKPMGLLYVLKRLAARADVPNVHPHRLRHTSAVNFVRAGGNVLVLQRILGHSTLAMTNRYVALVTDDLQREHERCSPVASLLGHAR
ncbi:MAG: tyrosine-type recombinase/integrase [Chloroflexota bacterium]|nr:tyrosine-type recombinase/integrase [Chloroflexota bacterium]